MAKKTKKQKREWGVLRVVPFTNPSGETAWRVTGPTATGRVRKNFPTKEEAETYRRTVVASEQLGENAPLRPVLTRASDSVIRDAEAARDILDDAGLSHVTLDKVAQYYAEHNQGIADLGVEEAIDRYLESMRTKGNREQYISIKEDMLNDFSRRLGGNPALSSLRTDTIRSYVHQEGIADSTKATRRATLSGLFAWALNNGYLTRNPIQAVEGVKVRRGLPGILSVEQAHHLIQVAAEKWDGQMLPYFAVCLFSGIRPDEAKRLDSWDLFDFEHGHIQVSEQVSKVNARFTDIHPNLRDILQWCKQKGLSPGFYSRTGFREIKAKAGLDFSWTGEYNDLLRHSYASYHWAMHKSLEHLSYTMGNSPRVLRSNYIRSVSPKESEKFFSISLDGASG